MTDKPLTKEEAEAVESLIGWALDEDHAAFEPGWLESRFDFPGVAEVLQSASGKISGGVAREVYIVITPTADPPEQWDVEILDEFPKWNWIAQGQFVRVAHINGGDSAMTHPMPGTADRADVTRRLAQAFGYPMENLEMGSERALLDVFGYVHGIVNEYQDGGDQMVESFCICGVSPGGYRILNPVCPEHGVNS